MNVEEKYPLLIGHSLAVKDLADNDLIALGIFDLICNAMAIRRFG